MSNCGLPEDQCCLNRSGMCTLDTAEYTEIDRATEMRGCGFIGVNDRYLMWKYGVVYKDFICGHCRFYKGETHGECTMDKDFGIGGNSRYSGAHACELFKKQEEVREVPKQKYWTKCGREFQKNSIAVVTGYEIDINDPECADCPFQVDVKEGWPLVHEKWECRAGSQPPNHTTEWTGSLENKNTISIHSLDNQLMEEIKEYCENHPDLGAGYNADYMADCRRTLAISCSSNKKGMAAKRELIEKFFPEETETEVKEVYLEDNKKCSKRNEQCGYYCDHNGGCSLLIVGQKALKDVLDGMQTRDEECAVYKQTRHRFYPEPAALEEVTANVITFDYTTVDEETSAFLQEKAQKITEIRIKSVIALGKELKEAQDRLASHNKYDGVFTKWIESAGLKKSTAYNYIQAYDYVVQNLDNIEDANNIQPSLLFAASKPSAPAELQQGVLSGDITTHKQYKELEDKLKDAEFHYDTVKKSYERLEKVNTEHYKMRTIAEKDVANLRQQLDQAQRNSDTVKVQELGQKIADYQQEIEGYQEQVGQLNTQLQETKQQLHDKPIEVAATEVVEKEIIPDEVAEAIYCKIKYLYEGIKNLTAKEIQIFADHVDPAYYDTLTSDIDEAAVILEKISSAAYGATKYEEQDGHCGDCVHADMDAVTEEQLDEGKTRCTVTGKIVDIMDGCGKYKSYREGQ